MRNCCVFLADRVWQPERFFKEKRTSSSSFYPRTQSELVETSRPISCSIQRKESHYWLMRRRGIKAFILITVMSVCKRAACTCFPPLLFSATSGEWILTASWEGNESVDSDFYGWLFPEEGCTCFSFRAEQKSGGEPDLSRCQSEWRAASSNDHYWLARDLWDGCTCAAHLTARHLLCSPPHLQIQSEEKRVIGGFRHKRNCAETASGVLLRWKTMMMMMKMQRKAGAGLLWAEFSVWKRGFSFEETCFSCWKWLTASKLLTAVKDQQQFQNKPFQS